jgi:hypothetical protein
MSEIEIPKDFLEKMHILIKCYDNAHNTEKITQKHVIIKNIYIKENYLGIFSVSNI